MGLTIHKECFLIKKQQWKLALKTAKMNYYMSKFRNSRSCKQLFGICDELLGRSKQSSLPSIYEDSALPNMFAVYFSEKVQNLRDNLDGIDICQNHHKSEGSILSHFNPVSEEYVKSIILKAPIKSCDLDPIPTSLFSKCVDDLIPSITSIINKSLIDGSVPACFKSALVTPLLKKSTLDHNDLQNYRPVSNLAFLSKILEKIVLDQLRSHLETNKLAEILQSAYRAQHSTETALLKVMNDILTECDSGNVSLLNLLDLSAAFATIDHSILLQRLEITFGVSGTALEWFKSYLSNRHQAVVIKGKKSSDHLLKYGVPQGSVLGPVLFTLYTQPLVQEIVKFNLKYHFYADGTQLYDSVHRKNFEDLCHRMECCIKCVKKWMNENRLMLNDNKTEVLLTGSAGSLSKLERSSIHIGDSDIKFSNKVKKFRHSFRQRLSKFKPCKRSHSDNVS